MTRRISVPVIKQPQNHFLHADSGSVESKNIQDDSDKMFHPEPDLALISELLQTIEHNPLAQEAHLLLMQHYAMCSWHDAAKEEAHRVLQIDSTVKEAQKYLEDFRKASLERGGEIAKVMGSAKFARDNVESKKKDLKAIDSREQRAQALTWRPSLFPITSPEASLQELEEGYTALLKDAKLCLSGMNALRSLKAPDCEDHLSDLVALVNGQVSSVVGIKHLENVEAVAEAVVACSSDGSNSGVDVALKDLEDLVNWLIVSGDPAGISIRSQSTSTGKDDQNGTREALVKRVSALKAFLPKLLQPIGDLALMHAGHELLHRKYVNDETMVSFDTVSSIPRATFWSSEDGYAWDMEELVSAITSGKGVMRNPLSKQMFTKTDIRAIIQHPLGNGLRALQLKQSKLKRGVRPETIDELDTLAKILLADMTEDGKPSHLALEAFTSYLETLPTGEQQAIQNLKVPAKDSHTGIAFDGTIGDAVKDVQGNRVCSHKAGDFLAQAVRYLK